MSEVCNLDLNNVIKFITTRYHLNLNEFLTKLGLTRLTFSPHVQKKKNIPVTNAVTRKDNVDDTGVTRNAVG